MGEGLALILKANGHREGKREGSFVSLRPLGEYDACGQRETVF